MTDARYGPLTLIVVPPSTRIRFAPVHEGRAETYPHVLSADNLRTASNQSKHLEPDDHQRRPHPLLRIHDEEAPTSVASQAWRALDGTTDRTSAIWARWPARNIAGLIADAVRAGVAQGAVLFTAGSVTYSDEVASHISASGFKVISSVPGWTLEIIRSADLDRCADQPTSIDRDDFSAEVIRQPR
ncbi:hypothetical protein R1CP_36760 (plasmid) [Rhodococcus opacus]|uniref:Uncharacterized protein n=1 Tax=Rhodococcus opacus TaxID=37919 RepID=A0A1B1KH99_RHOOP|nr:hypothetical protein R1CP_36760 [Rhodococcus opacus]